MARLNAFFAELIPTISRLRWARRLRGLTQTGSPGRLLISEYETGRCQAACEKSKKISQCYEPVDSDCALG